MPITGTELDTISTDTSSGSGDSGKIVLLNSSGLVDDTMLPDFGAGTITTVAGSNGISVSGGTGPTATVSPSYGTTSTTICVGNDSRLSDSRAPNGSAGGDLAGSYPNPTVAKIHETGGPTALTIGAIADGKYLVRSGSTLVGADGGATGTTWYWFYTSEDITDTDGVENDYAIVVGGPTGNGNIYQKVTGHWTAIGNIRGAAGTEGTIVRSGTTAPDNGVGVNGDFYLRSSTGEFYKMVSGTYTLILTMQLSLTYSTGLNLAGSTLTVSFGTSSSTACIGNDSRLSDSRAPNGSAGGDLAGSYPNPTVAKIHETGGPTALTFGSINDGEFLKRSGTNIVSAAGGSTITVKNAGTTVGTRGALNLIAGTNVTLTTTDNSGSDRVDVTIASSGGGGGGSGGLVPLWTPPTSAHANDAEFDSTTLPTGFVFRNQTGTTNETPTTGVDPYTAFTSGVPKYSLHTNWRKSFLTYQIKTSTDVYVMAYPVVTSLPTNCFLWASFQPPERIAGSSLTNPEAAMAFTVMPDVSGHPDDSSSNWLSFGYFNIGGTQIKIGARNGGSTVGTDTDATWNALTSNTVAAFGLQKLGTTWHFWLFRYDGRPMYWGSATYSSTVGWLGWRTGCNISTNPANGLYGVDFIRQQDSATGWPGK